MDLRDYTGPLVADIEVTISRLSRPYWRVQTKSVINSRFARDPVAEDRGIGSPYDVPATRDPELSARLADDIRRRLTAKP